MTRRFAALASVSAASGIAVVCTAATARADDDSAIARYRKIWNPFSAGPELVSSADVQVQGQMFLRPYIYSELAYGQFNGWAVANQGLNQNLYAIAPQIEFSYGILDWLEYEMYVPENSWWQTSGGGRAAATATGSATSRRS